MLLHGNVPVFDLLNEMAGYSASSARCLRDMVRGGPPEPAYDQQLKQEGEGASRVMHQLAERLAHLSQPPIYPEDVLCLARELGAIVDAIRALAQRLQLYHAGTTASEFRQQIEVLSDAAQVIDASVHALRKRRGLLPPMVTEIRRLKDVGDDCYEAALARLYEGNPEVLAVLRSEELHDLAEDAIRQCKDVANTLERISLESA